MTDIRIKLFCSLQHFLPHHLLSRLLAKLADAQFPPLKNFLIRLFIRVYKVEIREALRQEVDAYSSFNDFFTRALKPDVRPIDDDTHALISPADGTTSQSGKVTQGNLLQAKGHTYRTADLLGDTSLAAQFDRGQFFTIYLSPKDYHRIHMPITGTLVESRYIPGRLFSVNSATTAGVDGLFARNERLVCTFNSAHGPFVLVMVGAMLVAGIETVWQKHYAPGTLSQRDHRDQNIQFTKGEEIGRFKFGSTVIVLAPAHAQLNNKLTPGTTLRMGETLAEFSNAEASIAEVSADR